MQKHDPDLMAGQPKRCQQTTEEISGDETQTRNLLFVAVAVVGGRQSCGKCELDGTAQSLYTVIHGLSGSIRN